MPRRINWFYVLYGALAIGLVALALPLWEGLGNGGVLW
jgi:hypothetical protein